MKHLLNLSMALGVAAATLFTLPTHAQTVNVNALGSSGLFLELGLGAHYSGAGGLNASCVWSGSGASATDRSTGTALIDSGNAWVAWTTGTGGTCSSPSTDSVVYSYLQTDSVVGNRCLFNGSNCTISYPTTNPAPANLILASGEVNLVPAIAAKINAAAINAAGTDIRPEDAKFAINRALTACKTPVVAGSQYLGLGYINGGTVKSSDKSFNVINFSLPSSFAVTNVGATPVLVVVNSNDTSAGLGQAGINSFTSSVLAKFLDGSDFHSDNLLRVNPSASGDTVNVYLREPLSGTYNTMEYNNPNTTTNKTSQDVGVNQPASQINCNGAVPLSNPMNIATSTNSARIRAIGTGEELADVQANSGGNSLGYGFWSVANYAKLATVPTAKYLQFYTGSAAIDPLLKSGTPYTGAIPGTGSAALANVDLSSTKNGTYPIYSLLRLVNIGSQNTHVAALAQSAQLFVTFGSSTSRPDFVTPAQLAVVRSHFTPPGVSFSSPLANGDSKLGSGRTACTALPESGGDVGGVIYTLSADSTYCTNNHVTTGQTGHRN